MNLLRMAVLVSVGFGCGSRQLPLPDSGAFDRSTIDLRSRDERSTNDQFSKDAVTGAVSASLSVVEIFADCMPIVAPDPVRFTGYAELSNNSKLPVGPVQFSIGRVIDYKTGQELATFTLYQISPIVIYPGERLATVVEKAPNSMNLNNCLKICVGLVRIELAYEGPGVPQGSKVLSPPATLSCGV